MTRINLIDPRFLSRRHLLAEYRELPRVFRRVRIAQAKGKQPKDFNIPIQFVLGKGHETFFYNKLLFLVQRQESIITECLRRDYQIQFKDSKGLIKGIDRVWCNHYTPTIAEVRLSLSRIVLRGKEDEYDTSRIMASIL